MHDVARWRMKKQDDAHGGTCKNLMTANELFVNDSFVFEVCCVPMQDYDC